MQSFQLLISRAYSTLAASIVARSGTIAVLPLIIGGHCDVPGPWMYIERAEAVRVGSDGGGVVVHATSKLTRAKRDMARVCHSRSAMHNQTRPNERRARR